MDTSTTSPINKEKIQSISKVFKVISDPTRLSILFLLQKEELSVGNIVLALDMEQSAISHQLKILKDSRLVKARREGKSMVYSLDDLHVFSILEQLIISRESLFQDLAFIQVLKFIGLLISGLSHIRTGRNQIICTQKISCRISL